MKDREGERNTLPKEMFQLEVQMLLPHALIITLIVVVFDVTIFLINTRFTIGC